MERMNEVFELPVFESFDWLCGSSKVIAGEFINHSQAKHAAHAINNVDALADALDDLMEWHVKHVNVANHPAYDGAYKALNAYRGAK